jgi:HD superfamily phosphohydrolase
MARTVKIPLPGFEHEIETEFGILIDSAPVQRLNHIAQLPFTYLVFPGATHTRFAHSLGVMENANQIATYMRENAKEMGLPIQDETEMISFRVAGLLHDIGHAAYSHESENMLLELHGDKDHDDRTVKKLESLKDKIAECGASYEVVRDILSGDHPLNEALLGVMGADKLDYLIRDRESCGLRPSETRRVKQAAIYDGKRFAIDERALNEVEHCLVMWIDNHIRIYCQKSVTKVREMYRRALFYPLMSGEIERDFVWDSTDREVFNALERSSNDVTRKLINKLECREGRKLPKMAGAVKIEEYSWREAVRSKPIHIETVDQKSAEALEDVYPHSQHWIEIAEFLEEALDLEPGDVTITHFPYIDKVSKVDVDIYHSGKLRSVHEDIAGLHDYLGDKIYAMWGIRFYVPEEERKRVYEIFEEKEIMYFLEQMNR